MVPRGCAQSYRTPTWPAVGRNLREAVGNQRQ